MGDQGQKLLEMRPSFASNRICEYCGNDFNVEITVLRYCGVASNRKDCKKEPSWLGVRLCLCVLIL